jgi:hypothetical protein
MKMPVARKDADTGQSLQDKQQRRHEQKPDYGSLCRRNRHLIDRTESHGRGFRFAPAKPIVAAKKIQDQPGPA